MVKSFLLKNGIQKRNQQAYKSVRATLTITLVGTEVVGIFCPVNVGFFE